MEGRVYLDREAQGHVDAYVDYVHNGGEKYGEFNEKNYQLFKAEQEKYKLSKVYTSWRSNAGKDCKSIGPATKCFCDHRYKDHNYLNPKDKKIHCQFKGCKCPTFEYIPVHGSYDFKCLCKHSYKLHDVLTKKCTKCSTCEKLKSTWSCSCNLKYFEHYTIVETRDERIAQGRFVSTIEGFLLENMAENSRMQNFTDMLDHNEQFGAKVEAYNEAIANKNQLEYADKLALLNGQELEDKNPKNQKALAFKKAESHEAQAKVQQRVNCALDLYLTPHKYA